MFPTLPVSPVIRRICEEMNDTVRAIAVVRNLRLVELVRSFPVGIHVGRFRHLSAYLKCKEFAEVYVWLGSGEGKPVVPHEQKTRCPRERYKEKNIAYFFFFACLKFVQHLIGATSQSSQLFSFPPTGLFSSCINLLCGGRGQKLHYVP